VFRYLVLGILRDRKPRHGYALMKEYRDRSGLQLSTGSFYRELQRLAGEDLVKTTANPAGEDARRAPYEITDAGLAAFDGWFAGPARPALGDYEDDLSDRALFVGDSDPKVVHSVMERLQESLWIGGKMLERAREAALAQGNHGGRDFRILAFLLSRRLKHVAADLEFLEEFRAAYDEWVASSRGTAAPTEPRAALSPLPPRPRETRPPGKEK
jgi:DNA-binding PadR family transcriptional regulator